MKLQIWSIFLVFQILVLPGALLAEHGVKAVHIAEGTVHADEGGADKLSSPALRAFYQDRFPEIEPHIQEGDEEIMRNYLGDRQLKARTGDLHKLHAHLSRENDALLAQSEQYLRNHRKDGPIAAYGDDFVRQNEERLARNEARMKEMQEELHRNQETLSRNKKTIAQHTEQFNSLASRYQHASNRAALEGVGIWDKSWDRLVIGLKKEGFDDKDIQTFIGKAATVVRTWAAAMDRAVDALAEQELGTGASPSELAAKKEELAEKMDSEFVEQKLAERKDAFTHLTDEATALLRQLPSGLWDTLNRTIDRDSDIEGKEGYLAVRSKAGGMPEWLLTPKYDQNGTLVQPADQIADQVLREPDMLDQESGQLEEIAALLDESVKTLQQKRGEALSTLGGTQDAERAHLEGLARQAQAKEDQGTNSRQEVLASKKQETESAKKLLALFANLTLSQRDTLNRFVAKKREILVAERAMEPLQSLQSAFEDMDHVMQIPELEKKLHLAAAGQSELYFLSGDALVHYQSDLAHDPEYKDELARLDELMQEAEEKKKALNKLIAKKQQEVEEKNKPLQEALEKKRQEEKVAFDLLDGASSDAEKDHYSKLAGDVKAIKAQLANDPAQKELDVLKAQLANDPAQKELDASPLYRRWMAVGLLIDARGDKAEEPKGEFDDTEANGVERARASGRTLPIAASTDDGTDSLARFYKKNRSTSGDSSPLPSEPGSPASSRGSHNRSESSGSVDFSSEGEDEADDMMVHDASAPAVPDLSLEVSTFSQGLQKPHRRGESSEAGDESGDGEMVMHDKQSSVVRQ